MLIITSPCNVIYQYQESSLPNTRSDPTVWQSYQNFHRPNWFQQYYIFIQTVNVKRKNNISGALNRRGKNWKRNKQM